MKHTIHKTLNVKAGHGKLAVTFAIATAAFIMPSVASADAIIGNLVLSGHLTEVIAVSGTQIDFDFTGAVSNTFPPVATSGTVDGSGDSGLFDVAGASTQSFASLTGSTVTVHDLDAASEPVGATSGPLLPLSNFITFGAQPTWSITLTQLLQGAFGSADCFSATPKAGQTCSLPNSPFNLSNLAGNQVNVAFTFLGTASDGAGHITNISGEFGSTFSNTNLQAIVAAVQAGQSVVTSGSATIAAVAVATVPEPGSTSLFLMGVALVGGVIACRRRSRNDA